MLPELFPSCGEPGLILTVVLRLLTAFTLLVWSSGSRPTGSVVVAHGFRCLEVCGIFPDPESNLCPLRWQADSALRPPGKSVFLRKKLKREGKSLF